MDITAVAFDIDGTLYPAFGLYGRLISFTAFHLPLMFAFEKTRKLLHAEAAEKAEKEADYTEKVKKDGGFYKKQANLLAKFLKINEKTALDMVETQIYEKWTELFKKIKPFPHVFDTISSLKTSGYKLGILSDFPVRAKLSNMGLSGFWDTELCTEEFGALKPHPAGFTALAEALETPPERVLYVGNSYRFDIKGAAAAGMNTALVSPFVKRRRFNGVKPNLVFSDYRELSRFLQK